MKRIVLLGLLIHTLYALPAQTTDPMITSWWFNTTNQTFTGTQGSALVNVEAIYYSSSIVYVKSSGIPSYYADGVTGAGGTKKPKFDGKDQANVFKLPRTQTVATTATRTYLRDQAQMAVLIDGSVALTPCDGKSYNSAGVWHQLAYKFEGNDFDSYLGHSTPGNQYHHHVSPTPLYSSSASTTHSGIIGYAFDGYPVYGPYGYTNTNGTGAIKRMTPSWAVRNMTDRTTLPDGSTASSSGPTLATYALGYYFEDYAYTANSGDLDQYNGRFCVTPQYPSGTYCYFLTIDASLNPQFPYFVGDYFYGVVQSGNLGPTGGNNTVPGTATLYSTTTPVELTSFRAKSNECSVDITWKSQTEIGFKQYELEVSDDGKNFGPLSIEAAKGNNSDYIFRHNAAEGTHYYRLKMVDWNGSFAYSPIASATNSCIFKHIPVKVYPNPTVNDVTIEVTEGKNYTINLYSGIGVLLETRKIDKTIAVDMSNRAAGTYVVEVIDQTTKNGYMQKLIKQ